jgi:hypothetical protein
MNNRSEGIHHRIVQRLRRYVGEDELASVCDAVLHGRVVRLPSTAPLDIVALRHGVLFVAGTEFAIGDD